MLKMIKPLQLHNYNAFLALVDVFTLRLVRYLAYAMV